MINYICILIFIILFTIFSSLLSYDTTLRCNFVDLYYTLFGRQKIVRAEVAALYKPIKVEVEVNYFLFSNMNESINI